MRHLFVTSSIALLGMLAACSVPTKKATPTAPSTPPALTESSDPSRYQHDKDFAPLKKMDTDNIADAVPRIEPIKKAGNKSPYMVFGKVYHVMPDSTGYQEQGKASWYGLKFHGHNTSNGEVYDVSGMTAAHKTLPLPSYVKVTNIANGRTAIVRVNDRGPFHGDRIIDLSYAAATKLGYIAQGVADVKVEAIDVQQWQQEQQAQQHTLPMAVKTVWLQVGAYTQEATAQSVRQRLVEQFAWPTRVESGIDQFYRVKIGPVADNQVATISSQLLSQGFPPPVKLKP